MDGSVRLRGPMSSGVEIQVSEVDAGTRLDVLLVRRVPGLSRKRARDLAESGEVRVNGRRVKKGATLAAGDVVTLPEPTASDTGAVPDPDLPLEVVHEDAHLVVVEKRPGVPSHPLKPGEKGTVANALLARYPEMAGVGYSPREPGIVHRLDTDTSGLLLAARSTAAFEALRDALKQGRIDKHYLALCEGWIAAPRTISYPLAPHPKDPKRVLACVDERDVLRYRARPAVTEVLTSDRAGEMTLAKVGARPAGRHQIRAHLAAAGHPLAGDRLYGGPAIEGLGRHFLHATWISLVHPVTEQRLELSSELPADLRAALDIARPHA
jgi:23S rRNA pseudouridine1911/1915/1917 synthase